MPFRRYCGIADKTPKTTPQEMLSEAIDSRSGKFGIIGMQERAQLLNGTMTLHSELGKGTSIIIEIPAEK